MKKVLTSLYAIILTIIFVFLRGFIFSKYWSWFIMPIFQIRELSIAESLGILFTIGVFILKDDKIENKEEFWIKVEQKFLSEIPKLGIMLLSGWLLQLFI